MPQDREKKDDLIATYENSQKRFLATSIAETSEEDVAYSSKISLAKDKSPMKGQPSFSPTDFYLNKLVPSVGPLFNLPSAIE
ncbi:hypothetical protein Tco_1238807 [Tanacetum coccineum]